VPCRAASRNHVGVASERLSSLDASFLRVETPAAHMHVAWKGFFRPLPGHAPVTLAALRAHVASRLRHAPRFRQRLAFPPGGLAEPVWVDDDRFNLGHHVSALAGDDEPLSRRRFDELADLALSEPLDRSRALWRILVAPRLEDGSLGLVMKAHHAMVDGKSAVALALLLLDVAPGDAPAEIDDAWRPRPAPGAARLAIDALAERGREPLRAATELVRLAANPARGGRIADTVRRAALSVGEDMLRPAPSSYVNVPIGARRTLVTYAVPVQTALDVRASQGTTLNDVCLAVVAGALRQVALERRSVPGPLKVMVPVSRREDSEAGSLGNRISFVFIDLPVHRHRPLDRLAAINAATQAFKNGGRAAGGETVLGALGALPEPLKTPAAKIAASPRMYNLTISNVPGPRQPVYLLGAELIHAFPVIPISEGHALSVGIFSYHETLCFGGYADPTALPEASKLPAALNASMLELARAAGARPAITAAA
jgi:diacylglycerol O-acyltransferase / wax synthase